MPALVVLLGGGPKSNGNGIISDKLIKIPSKRGPDALRLLLDDYEANAADGEYYHDYFVRMGRIHFYNFLKPLGDISVTNPLEYIDWGEDHNFVLHTAVGECAGVVIDLVSTLLFDSEEKIAWAKEALDNRLYADSIYHSYSAFINTAKAMLLTVNIKPSTQIQTLNDFHQQFVVQGHFAYAETFKEHVLRINKNEPSEIFAIRYLDDAKKFVEDVFAFRTIEKEPVTKS